MRQQPAHAGREPSKLDSGIEQARGVQSGRKIPQWKAPPEMAPAGTPRSIIDKLNAAVNEVVKRPDVVKLWTQQGAVPMSMTPEEFDKFLRGDIVKWAEVVKKFDKPPQ